MRFNKTKEGICYLHSYYPTRYVEHEGVSESIIAFKQGYQISIDRFAKELEEALLEELGNDKEKFKDRYLVIIPSHVEGKWSESLLRVARYLCQNLNMQNYSYALERTKTHVKLTMGGDRSVESHISTMRLNPTYDMKGKKVIVLDDVTTSGRSIFAAAKILKEAGAERIGAMAIGRTTTGTLPSAF